MRWKMTLEDNLTKYKVTPMEEEMCDFVMEGVELLQKKCALAEERMIFESSSDEVLGRIIRVCTEIMAERTTPQGRGK